jgi:hypothetical protein
MPRPATILLLLLHLLQQQLVPHVSAVTLPSPPPIDHPLRNIPKFESDVYNVSVPEEITEQVMVTQVAARDLDLREDEQLVFLNYSIRDQSDGLRPPFRIDQQGVIWTTDKLDREERSNYSLEVVVEDETGLSSSCLVHVNVEDRNDNPPRFTRLFSANISEAASRGTFVIQVTSSDKDLDPAYTEATYSLIGHSDVFEIEAHTGRVFLISSLDRETRDEYLLTVAANDSSWRAQTTVTISVLDFNDNAPKFEKSIYEFRKHVSADEPQVGRVRASDADLGVNAEIEYQWKNESDLWALHPMTGEITVLASALSQIIDHPLTQYNLTIIAKDRGNPSLWSEVTTIITVLPKDSDTSIQTKELLVPVPFNLHNGSIVYTLRSPAIVTPIRNRLILKSDGHKLLFAGEGVAEVGAKYMVSVKSVVDEFNLTIVIVLPNMHTPAFPQSKYQIMVHENANVTDLLAPFSAVDDDPNEFNRDIVYSYKVIDMVWNERAIEYLKGETSDASVKTNEQISKFFSDKPVYPLISDPFRMDPDSGTLYLHNPLDYELVVAYRLLIIAKDRAWFDSKNSSVTAVIHVMDVNDNRPLFTNSDAFERGLEVYENNLVGQIVGDIRAVDFDSLPNSQITFEIEPLLDYMNFSISAKTGQIQALTTFDYERRNEYSLSVVAKNDEVLKSTSLLKIRVKDINEQDGASQDAVSFGVIVIVVFFVILLMGILTSFVLFQKQQKRKDDHSISSHYPLPMNLSVPRKMPSSSLPLKPEPGHSAMSLMPTPAHLSLHSHSRAHLMPVCQQRMSAGGQQISPDIIDAKTIHHQKSQRVPPAPPAFPAIPGGCDNYSEILVTEHYDLENASSIAPSDLDMAFRFQSYHHHHLNQRLPSVPAGPPHPSTVTDAKPDHRHVPLARLSPSVSELTAPRILTLQDLSPSAQSGIPTNRHPTPSKLPRRPAAVSDEEDDDGGNTVDSFTSSEYEETPYQLDKSAGFQRVW